jgi:hypothetical protein
VRQGPQHCAPSALEEQLDLGTCLRKEGLKQGGVIPSHPTPPWPGTFSQSSLLIVRDCPGSVTEPGWKHLGRTGCLVLGAGMALILPKHPTSNVAVPSTGATELLNCLGDPLPLDNFVPANGFSGVL